MSHYVYVLRSSADTRFYTGCTNNLRKRFKQHCEGKVSATKDRLPVELIYYEMCHNQSDAYNREKYLKTGMGKRYINNRLKSFLSLTD
jgi:putative endonuclease